jgi:hypothetical protein
MPITSADIYPLARWLHALIPAPLQRWTGEPRHPDERDRLPDRCLEVLHDPFEGNEDDDENTEMIGQMTVQSEALVDFVMGWDCRYGNLADDVDRAQAAPVTALGAVVQEQGCLSSRLAHPSPWWRSPTSLAGCASWRCRGWGRTIAESTMDECLAHLIPTKQNVRYTDTTARRFLFQCSAPAITPPCSRFHGFSMVKSGRKEPAPTQVGYCTLGTETSTGKT